MFTFQKLRPGIWRLRIPFEDVTTDIFALLAGDHCLLADSGACEEDVQQHILPALAEAGLCPEVLLISHMHGDHCGGAEALLHAFPALRIATFADPFPYPAACALSVKEGAVLFDRFRLHRLPGHNGDCLGVWDTESDTLLTFDALQQRGVGKFGTSFISKEDYFATLRRIAELQPRRLIASHDYVPLGDTAEGCDAVACCLETCRCVAEEILLLIQKQSQASSEEIARLYRAQNPLMPPISASVIHILRQ